MKKKSGNQCGRRGEKIFSNICIIPSLAGVLIFFLIPFGIVIYYSFVNNSVPAQSDFVGLENYKAILHNTSFRIASKNTALFSVIAIPLAIIIPLWLAILLERNIPCKSIFRTFFLSLGLFHLWHCSSRFCWTLRVRICGKISEGIFLSDVAYGKKLH